MRYPLLASFSVAFCAAAVAADPAALPLPPLDRAPLPATSIDELYNAAVLHDGSVDAAVRTLTARADDQAQTELVRSNALLLASHLQWRFGRFAPALALANRALALHSSGELILHRAKLLEASGATAEAKLAYGQALAALTDGEAREDVQLRLTFLDTNAEDVDALVTMARQRDRDFRNRAAVALAILNHPAEAATLYEPTGTDAALQHQYVRLAQWALQARLAGPAQAAAWQAVTTGVLTRDLRYSLSLLVEAHELDESWDQLLTRFAAHPELGPDALAVRIDLLRRLRRYDEAIALAEADRTGNPQLENQRRLLQLYRDAGRGDALIAQFRQLMADHPAEVLWPRSLSEFLIEQGRRPEAEAVWRAFLAHNTEPDVLLGAGEAIAQLGFDTLALDAGTRCQTLHPDTATRVAWYRFEHFLRHGAMREAEATLQAMEQSLPDDSPYWHELTDAYERLRLPQRAIAVWERLQRQQGTLGLDDRMRLAWLYDVTGQRERALGIWRELWNNELPEARRRQIEDRLILLAAELGSLGDIAVELEQKLAAGNAAAKDRSLLIRIYTEVNDPAAAIEVSQEYFGRHEHTAAAEIESLREQARIYQALNKPAAFAQITEKLLRLDPDNRTDYLQSLVLSSIGRNTKPDRDRLPALLSDLRATNATADDEFEAGVLVLANMKEQAIDSYRRALARNPNHSDDYLLLVDLLKQNRRQDEATAMLQYFAETAATDDGFMVAIDGILNLRPASDSPVLQWARRRVLERITRHDDKYYLYDLSAELAEEAKDPKGQIASLENALVEAGPRRTSVLRELIAVTDDKPAEMPTQAAGTGDLVKNLAYSRRLIALGEELPPEVYLNVGRSFLRLERPVEALRAFEFAIERTNRPALLEESADRFDAAGYTRQATALYEKALAADAENISLLSKLAALRQREGDGTAAHEFYRQCLLKLAAQQLVEIDTTAERKNVAPVDENLPLTFRRNYWGLQNGFILTSPPADVAADLAPFEAAFDQALQEVEQRANGRIGKPLESYPRLEVLARVVRLSALHSGHVEIADRTDLKLLRAFGANAKLVTTLVEQRLGWGLRASAETLRTAPGVAGKIQETLAARVTASLVLGDLVDLPTAARAAIARKNFDLAVETALAANDRPLALAIYQDWIGARAKPETNATPSSVSPSLAAISVGGGIIALSGGASTRGLGEVLTHARTRLEPADFAALCRQVGVLVEKDPTLGRDLLNGNAGDPLRTTKDKPLLTSIEEALGHPLFTPEKLAAAVANPDPRRLASLDLNYVLTTLPAPAGVALFIRTLQGSPAAGIAISPLVAGLRILLTQPIEPAAAAQLSAVIRQRFDLAAKSPFGLTAISSMASAISAPPLVPHPANVAFLAELDRTLDEAFPEAFSSRPFRQLVLQTSETSVPIGELVAGALREASRTDSNPGMSTYRLRQFFSTRASTLYPARKAEFLAAFEAKIAADGLTPPLFQATLALLQSDPKPDLREMVAWLERLLARNAGQRLALEALGPLYRQLGEFGREHDTLAQLIKVAPENEATRLRLAVLDRLFDHPENALQVLRGHARALPADTPDDGGSFVSFYLRQFPQLGIMISALSTPDPKVSIQAPLRCLLQLLPASAANQFGARSSFSLDRLALDYSMFFDLAWTPPRRFAEDYVLSDLLSDLKTDTLGTNAGGTERLLARLAQRPDALAELEPALRMFDPSVPESEGQYLYYPILADAYVAAGQLETECARLTLAVRGKSTSKRDVLLWLELASRLPGQQLGDLASLAETTLLATGSVSNYQRIQLARLFARTGHGDQAVGIYTLAAIGSMNNPSIQFTRSNRPSLFSTLGLMADAAQYLDAESLAKLTERVLALTKPRESAAQDAVHRRFALSLLEQAWQHGVPPQRLRPLLRPIDPVSGRRDDLARQAGLQSRLGGTDDALASLRMAVTQPAESSSGVRALDLSARYAMNLGYPSVFQSDSTDTSAKLLTFRSAFPLRRDAWPEAAAWTNRAAAAIASWLDDPAINRDLAVQLLALVALRQHQLALPESETSLRALHQALAHSNGLTPRTLSLSCAVSTEIGQPIPAAIVRPLIEARRLDVHLLAGVVRQVAIAEGKPVALALGESTLTYTENDELLGELVTLATELGDTARVSRLTQLRAEAARIRRAFDEAAQPQASNRRAA